MCGRYLLKCPPEILANLLELAEIPILPARYNIAPTQQVVAVRATEAGREFTFLRWGLVPFWADDVSIGNKLINARAETLAEKPVFRSAFRKRRCLLPASGFYEWRKEGKKKQPYRLSRPDEAPFLFAGLWEKKERDGEPALETCTIVTTEANAVVRPLHDRMPVILTKHAAAEWLDPTANVQGLSRLLKPISDDFLSATPADPAIFRRAGPDDSAGAAGAPSLF